MPKIRELVGDMFDHISINNDETRRGKAPRIDAFCCTTNTTVGTNGLVMGAGIAKAFRDTFPALAYLWGDRVLKFKPKTKTYVLVNYIDDFAFGNNALIYFPTKHDWKLPSPPALIERSAKQLRIIIEAMGWQNVMMPRPGCSNGKLHWDIVRAILNLYLDERVIVINKE